MANGDQTSLVTNQQPIGQQQGLMTEEETVEQPKTLYETLFFFSNFSYSPVV